MGIVQSLEVGATRAHRFRWLFLIAALGIGFALQRLLPLMASSPSTGPLLRPTFGVGSALLVWLWGMACLSFWAHPERGFFSWFRRNLPALGWLHGVLYRFALAFLVLFMAGGFICLWFGFTR